MFREGGNFSRTPIKKKYLHSDIIKWYNKLFLTHFYSPMLSINDIVLFYSLLLTHGAHIRGFRAIIGLPCRGQRTWSNGKTAKKNHTVLYNYKYTKFKKVMRLRRLTRPIFLAEYINLFWYQQYFWEWVGVKRYLARAPIFARRRNFIDIYNINRLYIYNFYKDPNMRIKQKSHRKKKTVPKNKYATGFLFGFSRRYSFMLNR